MSNSSTEPEFLVQPCRRGCGMKVRTLSKSVTGLDHIRQKFQGICPACIKPEELEEIKAAHHTRIRKVEEAQKAADQESENIVVIDQEDLDEQT